MPRFEFDENKSRTNHEKHGIDFIEAQALWADPFLVEIPAKAVDEPRYMVMGRISNKHWSTIFAPRSRNIRIISVRRSRPEEVVIYES